MQKKDIKSQVQWSQWLEYLYESNGNVRLAVDDALAKHTTELPPVPPVDRLLEERIVQAMRDPAKLALRKDDWFDLDYDIRQVFGAGSDEAVARLKSQGVIESEAFKIRLKAGPGASPHATPSAQSTP